MPGSRATLGIDLHLELRGPRRKRALEEALRQAIADGQLPSGTRLPSSRTLAADLGMARNTVVDAYGQLTAEGWLASRHGSGTTVAERPPSSGEPAEDEERDLTRSWRYDLRPGRPDLSSFPRSAWLAASRRAWTYVPDADLGYIDPRGTRRLRETLAGYLGRVRGVRTSPSRIVICSGFIQAYNLLCQALQQRGATRVAVEGYGLTETVRVPAAAGLSVTVMSVDQKGADVASVEAADAAVLTPAHQFPLGTVLSRERRHAALTWARRHGAVIVEDDYDGEFRYDREPLGAVQGLAPEQVVYIGTVSKTLAPGLRLGWMVLPGDLVQPVVDAKMLADRHTAVLDQLTLAEFIRSGAYDRHVRRRRLAYRRRRDLLMGAFAEPCVEGISAGLHALVALPSGVTEADAVGAAEGRGLAVEGLDAYRAGPASHPPALVVGYATPAEHGYRAALAVLRNTLVDIGSPSGR